MTVELAAILIAEHETCLATYQKGLMSLINAAGNLEPDMILARLAMVESAYNAHRAHVDFKLRCAQ